MKPLVLALVSAASLQGSPFASPARAEPLVLSRTAVDNGYVKRYRYCDQQRRCWIEGYRNALAGVYDIAPPPSYARPEKTTTAQVATGSSRAKRSR